MLRTHPRFCLLALVLALVVSRSASAALLKGEMRNPWTRSTPFIRAWLVCGEFPNAPAKDAKAGAVPVGLTTDYLAEHGGEARIRPTAGMIQKRPDGTTATWTAYASPADTLNFKEACKGRPGTDVVAYAYTTITRDRGGPALLALGSDDGVRVWVNGKLVHDHAIRRGVRPDEDVAEASFRAGANAVLVKVEQGTGDWGLCLRVVEEGEARVLARRALAPALEKSAADRLAIRTDGSLARYDGDRTPVRVEVIGPGGKSVATQTAPRGTTVTFDTAGWQDGPYEVMCRMTPAGGQPVTAYVNWYKGDLVAAARTLVSTAKTADPATQAGMVHAMLADMVQDRLGADFSKTAAPNATEK